MMMKSLMMAVILLNTDTLIQLADLPSLQSHNVRDMPEITLTD